MAGAMFQAVDACQRGDLMLLQEALTGGVDVNVSVVRGYTVPNPPWSLNDLRVVEKPDGEGCSLLHWAAINNRVDVVAELLKNEADPNALGGVLMSSPLHWAARVGHLDTSVLLIQAGAECNVRDTQGFTPIHLAVQGNHIALVAYLIAKFDYAKNFTDNAGMTPTMWAAYRCYQMFPLRLIIRSGADINAQEDLQGNTALHFAVQERNLTAVRELLLHGADVSKKNKEHETALDIALNNRHLRIQEEIKRTARQQGSSPSSCRYAIRDNDNYKRVFQAAIPFIVLGISALVFHVSHYGVAALVTAIVFLLAMYCTSGITFANSFLPFAITVAEPLTMTATWCGHLHHFVPWYMQMMFPVAIVSLFVSLAYIALGDPGVLYPTVDAHEAFVIRVEQKRLKNFCFTCYLEKPIGAKHCSVCDRCVESFDHHCPWLNQCVTARNQRCFLVFVLSVATSSFIFFLACLLQAIQAFRGNDLDHVLTHHAWLGVTGGLALFHICVMGSLCSVQLIQISERDTTNDRIKRSRASGHGHTHGRNVNCAERVRNVLDFCCPSSSGEQISYTSIPKNDSSGSLSEDETQEDFENTAFQV